MPVYWRALVFAALVFGAQGAFALRLAQNAMLYRALFECIAPK